MQLIMNTQEVLVFFNIRLQNHFLYLQNTHNKGLPIPDRTLAVVSTSTTTTTSQNFRLAPNKNDKWSLFDKKWTIKKPSLTFQWLRKSFLPLAMFVLLSKYCCFWQIGRYVSEIYQNSEHSVLLLTLHVFNSISMC